jgi:hypothetical protein
MFVLLFCYSIYPFNTKTKVHLHQAGIYNLSLVCLSPLVFSKTFKLFNFPIVWRLAYHSTVSNMCSYKTHKHSTVSNMYSYKTHKHSTVSNMYSYKTQKHSTVSNMYSYKTHKHSTVSNMYSYKTHKHSTVSNMYYESNFHCLVNIHFNSKMRV